MRSCEVVFAPLDPVLVAISPIYDMYPPPYRRPSSLCFVRVGILDSADAAPPRRAEASTAHCFSMACSMTPRPPHSHSLGTAPARWNCHSLFGAFPVPVSRRGRVFFWCVETFPWKSYIFFFADLKCPGRSPLPKADRSRHGTQREINTNMNEKPDLEAIDKSRCTLTRGAKKKPTNFAEHRRIAREDRRDRRDRRGRVGGQERGRSVGESGGAEAARSVLRCPSQTRPSPPPSGHLSFFETTAKSAASVRVV